MRPRNVILFLCSKKVGIEMAQNAGLKIKQKSSTANVLALNGEASCGRNAIRCFPIQLRDLRMRWNKVNCTKNTE